MIDRSDELPRELRDHVRALRADVPMTDIWRQRVLHAVAERSRRQTRWSLRPATAIAAAVGFMLVGAVAASLARRQAPSPLPVAGTETHGAARVRFTFDAPSAGSVSIVGDFNGWTAGALPLRRAADGRWEIEVPLAPGRYAYAFIVDGRLLRDPSAPQARGDDFGTPNSVVMVSGS